MMRKPLTRTERRCLCEVLLLCALPLGYAYYTSLKKKELQQALKKYTDIILIGRPGYMRLKYGYTAEGAEGGIGLFVPRQTPHLFNQWCGLEK